MVLQTDEGAWFSTHRKLSGEYFEQLHQAEMAEIIANNPTINEKIVIRIRAYAVMDIARIKSKPAFDFETSDYRSLIWSEFEHLEEDDPYRKIADILLMYQTYITPSHFTQLFSSILLEIGLQPDYRADNKLMCGFLNVN